MVKLGIIAVLIIVVALLIAYLVAYFGGAARRRREALPLHLQGAPRREKRAYFRELREREQEQYDLQYQRDLLDLNNKETRRYP
jgi:hypothetical protein